MDSQIWTGIMLSAALATLERLSSDLELKSFTLNHNRFNQVQLIVRFDAANLGDGSLEKNSQTITKKSKYHQKRDKLRLDKFNEKFQNKSNADSSSAICSDIQVLGNPSACNVVTDAPGSGRKSPGEIASGSQVHDSGIVHEAKASTSMYSDNTERKSSLPSSELSVTTVTIEKGKSLKSKITGVLQSTSLAVKKRRTRDEISFPVGREPYEFRTRPGSVSSDTTGGKGKPPTPITGVSSYKTSKTFRRTGSSSSD